MAIDPNYKGFGGAKMAINIFSLPILLGLAGAYYGSRPVRKKAPLMEQVIPGAIGGALGFAGGVILSGISRAATPQAALPATPMEEDEF